ncbi:MAG TPA: DeoR/GlpR family DNA-binding transcription regulator [Ideonella sp.]|nr:DeoR/GlpR family DNA-binding transcription regulator [Ideonella sp.]
MNIRLGVAILQAQRIDRILALLMATGFRTNQALAQDLNVSEMTIRRDLNELAETGQVKRVRGGVRVLRRSDALALVPTDQQAQTERAIAEAAADQIADGETIYLDNGSAALALARALRQRELPHLRVVTNAVAVAALLCSDTCNVIQLGGEVRGTGAVVGQQAIRLIEAMRFDRCFLCADGYNVEFGISGKHLPEIEVKRAAMLHSGWVALIAESARWGKQSMLRIANLRDIHCLVTDEALDAQARSTIAERGLEVVIADG